MGRLLALENDVQDRVQPCGARQCLAKLPLGDAECVRRLAAPVQDAGDQALPAQAAGSRGAVRLAGLDLDLDSFPCHGAAV